MTIAKNKFDNIFANRSNIKLHVYKVTKLFAGTYDRIFSQFNFK